MSCDHKAVVESRRAASGSSTLGYPSDSGQRRITDANTYFTESKTQQFRDMCGKCGAKRIDKQIGLEPTPDAYVQNMVQVFREVRRVLKDDGIAFVNLGDSYAANRSYQAPSTKGGPKHSPAQGFDGSAMSVPDGLKPKDLVGIPWLVAFALRADGWYLRSDIIWSKPNPMPESVTDRPTKSHEYLFLLAKSQTYYYDADAIREPHAATSIERQAYGFSGSVRPEWEGQILGRDETPHSGLFPPDGPQNLHPLGRNRRSVWTIATQPYPGAHFAVMPEALVEPCVLAGSRYGDIVLDPFAGSGTVARVALRLGRRAIGCDLNPAYLKLADVRTQVTLGLPLDEGVA